MLRRRRWVWSAVRKDAQAVKRGGRRGALAARRGVKKGVSDYYPDALPFDTCPRGSRETPKVFAFWRRATAVSTAVTRAPSDVAHR